MALARLATFAAVAMVIAGQATAQTFPSHHVTIVVPYAAGGGADAVARIIAERMQSSLGQAVVVENVPGASGSSGAGRIARATPDGYTLVEGNWSTHVANGAALALRYDLIQDFAPIALISRTPLLIAGRKDLPAHTLRELIAWLRANPDKISEGTNGPGSIMHVAGLLFAHQTGTRFTFVPYRGAGAVMQDMLGGRVDLAISLPPDILAQTRTGAIQVFAVTSKQHLPAAPDIPTVDEAGAPGFYASAWFGLWAPKNTPPDVVARLNAAVVAALADATVRKRLTDLGMDVPPRDEQTPESLHDFQQREIDKWWPIIKGAEIKAE